MQHLELVITSDTAIAHLAGATRGSGVGSPGESCGLAVVVGAGRESVVSDDAVVSTEGAGLLEGSLSGDQRGIRCIVHVRGQESKLFRNVPVPFDAVAKRIDGRQRIADGIVNNSTEIA